MRDLAYEVRGVLARNRDGSYATQHDREKILLLAADHLHQLGYKHLSLQRLGARHMLALIEKWKAEVTLATLKNRVAALRWLAEKIHKPNLLPPTNAALQIDRRRYVDEADKSQALTGQHLAKITDPFIHLSVRLQVFFGLRREEALKLNPRWADRGDHLALKGSWTKGGRPRTIPIRTAMQRALIEEAKGLAGGGSMIPSNRRYVEHLRIYERQTRDAGLQGHQLRHHYAQQRYQELAGWPCPAKGGPSRRHMTEEQRAVDKAAREQVSRELGHVRIHGITSVYLGNHGHR